MLRQQPGELLTVLARPGDHFNDTGCRIVGEACFRDRPSRLANEIAVVEFEDLVRPLLEVDRDLREQAIAVVKPRTVPLEDLDMHVVRAKMLAHRPLERFQMLGGIGQRQPGGAGEAVPHPPATSFVGVPDVLGVLEALRIIEKHR